MTGELFDFGSVYDGSPDMFLAKLCLFFITFIVIFVTLRKSLDFDKMSSAVISIASGILATVFISEDLLLNYFLTSYGLFAILTLAFLPFFLFFYFIESFDFPMIRKFGFVMIGLFYFVVGYYEMGMFGVGSSGMMDPSWIYFGMAGLCLFIIVFERQVRKFVFYRRKR